MSSDRYKSARTTINSLHDTARCLRALIAAIDGRAPRAGYAAEPAIARDAALLRAKASSRLAEIAAELQLMSGCQPEGLS